MGELERGIESLERGTPTRLADPILGNSVQITGGQPVRHNRDRQETPAGVNLRPGRLVCAALLVVVGAFAVEALLGTQGSVDRLFNNWIYYGLLLASGACASPARCSFAPSGFPGSS